MRAASVTLTEAVELTRTGDVWLFRGHTLADRAIRVATNSPVNHVGMSVVIADLPPLMWHAELGRSLPDVWSGTRQRGVQLHDLREAVLVWANRYGQQAWLRQLDRPVSSDMEDAVLRTMAGRADAGCPATGRRGRPGDRLLRGSAGCHLPGHGAPAGDAAAELVRRGPVLERRSPGPVGRIRAGRRNRRAGASGDGCRAGCCAGLGRTSRAAPSSQYRRFLRKKAAGGALQRAAHRPIASIGVAK
jgi:hypothetical protein